MQACPYNLKSLNGVAFGLEHYFRDATRTRFNTGRRQMDQLLYLIGIAFLGQGQRPHEQWDRKAQGQQSRKRSYSHSSTPNAKFDGEPVPTLPEYITVPF